MSKLKILAFLLVLTTSSVIAQDEGKSGSSGTFYFHPVGLILSTIPNFVWITATYENNFADQKAFLLRPFYMRFGDSDDYLSMFALGAGIRNYLSKPQSGIYLDLMGNVGYSSIHIDSDFEDEVTGSGIAVSGLGYIGVKGKWSTISIMFDVGGGYQYVGANAEDNRGNEASASGGGPTFDINLGIGFNL